MAGDDTGFDLDKSGSPPPNAPTVGDLSDMSARTVPLSPDLLGGGAATDKPAADGSDALPILPDFELLEVVGHGGMGVVYKARQQSLDRLVAIKMVLGSVRASGVERQRFRREAEAVAHLQHPNIVQIHAVAEHEGRPYLVLEYVPGGNLAQRLAVMPMPARLAAEMMASLARAVQYAHEQGFVHRDLKPANILLQGSGIRGQGSGVRKQRSEVRDQKSSDSSLTPDPWPLTPKIADFGLVKELGVESDGETLVGAIIGTPGYMAPEQAAGQADKVGPATDTYALGAILYESLTGRPPFKAASVLETLEQIRHTEPAPPRRLQPKVPRDLETICLTCLHKESYKRYPSAGALGDDLQRFLKGEPIRARPVGMTERAWKWARRRPAVAGLLGALVLALVGGFAGMTWLWRQADGQRADAMNARWDALQQRDTVRAEKQRADDRYHQARSAMTRMLARLDDRRLAETPRLKELYAAQLGDAVTFYEGLLDEKGPMDPAVQRDVAEAFEQAGVIEAKLQLRAQARQSFHRAVKLWQDLITRDPDAFDDQAQLAVCYNGLAVTEGGDWQEKARELRERLCQAHPENVTWQQALAETYHNLAGTQRAAQDMAGATKLYEKALDILMALHRRFSQDPKICAEAGNNCAGLGLCYMATNQPDRAEAIFRQGEGLLRPLVEQAPPPPDHVLFLASLYIDWAILKREVRRRCDEAAPLAKQAIDLTEALLQREPRYYEARDVCLSAHGEHAYASDGLGHFAEAVRDWDRVLELCPRRDWPRFRALHGWTLLHAGDYKRAGAAARDLGADPKTPLAILYEAAKLAAASGGRIAKDKSLEPSQRTILVDADAALAIHLLERLEQAEVFKNPIDMRAFEQESAFEWMHDRDDFRKFRRRLR